MKTILVVYTNVKLTEEEAFTKKRYAFNTESKVKVGDFLRVEEYNCPLQVVIVLPTSFKYVNVNDGMLRNEIQSTRDYPLRELVVINSKRSPVSSDRLYAYPS